MNKVSTILRKNTHKKEGMTLSDNIDLHKELKRLRNIELVLNESSIVAFTNQRGIIQHANDKFCELSQYSKKELIGSPHSIINSGHHSKAFFKEMWRTIGTGNIWRGEIKNRRKDGTFYWVDTVIVPFLDERGKPYQYVAIRHDITQLKEQEAVIKKMAYYDHLTFLPNRNWVNEWAKRQTPETIKSLTVLFLDLDLFKSINDKFGHYSGDNVLKDVAKRLEDCLDPKDFIVRQGGDEFIIFLTSTKNDKEKVLSIVEDIKKQFTIPFYVNNEQLFITVSIGISKSPKESKGSTSLDIIEDAIIHADTAMYYAKKRYGNTHSFNTDEQNNHIDRYYDLVAELQDALGNNEFFLVYQPLIDLAKDKIVGVEALLRWKNEKLGFVSPVEFIPLLEELGLIYYVGNWVLQSVCKQMKAWQDKGVHLERVAINVSPIQFNELHFVTDVKKTLEETNLKPQFLELEITEGTIMDINKSESTLSNLKDIGVGISIDDFGTGYSSLSYLKRLPINTLKIDKSFIDDLDSDGKLIVNTIITMGTNLNYKVLAEGIETADQLRYLKSQNCLEGQGYFFSKPVSSEEIEQYYFAQ